MGSNLRTSSEVYEQISRPQIIDRRPEDHGFTYLWAEGREIQTINMGLRWHSKSPL